MRWYWTKIMLGALGVFVVGYGAVMVVRGAIVRGRSVIESSDPITIPLAFVPFTLEGQRIGTFQRVTIQRDAPKVVRAVDLRVKLEDSALVSALEGCELTTVNHGDFDIENGFTCIPKGTADSTMVSFGTVRVRGPGEMVLLIPLLLDADMVAELRNTGVDATREELATADAERARVHADSVALHARLLVDSVRAAVTIKLERARKAAEAPPTPGAPEVPPP